MKKDWASRQVDIFRSMFPICLTILGVRRMKSGDHKVEIMQQGNPYVAVDFTVLADWILWNWTLFETTSLIKQYHKDFSGYIHDSAFSWAYVR